VDLWTRDLTGVGAAIAAGSHLTKGHWALLVKERRRRITTNILLITFEISPPSVLIIPQKVIRRIASPRRLVKRVRSPPLALIQF
jgi:hypothetical protein